MHVVTRDPSACKNIKKCLLNLHAAAYNSHLPSVSLCQHLLSFPHHVPISTVLWWCTNDVTAYSYITVHFYIPFSVFIVTSVVPIQQLIVPHITVMLVVNTTLNYPKLPLVRVLKCDTILGFQSNTFCSLTSYQWLQCSGSSYTVTM